ncbi:MAG: hypothetical protein IT381_32770 [Deltaproteobacteria bacterium]|nr:hypothetical protein [Deltaproteobacteria bacterium]
MPFSDNTLVRDAVRALQQRLPPGWEAEARAPKGDVDAFVRLTAPNQLSGLIALEARQRLDPKAVVLLADQLSRRPDDKPLIVVARYLSGATRERLRERGLGYLDLTGNTRIVVRDPGLFIETQGASEDPEREQRPARSLKGAKAGRIVRALVDLKTPAGVRELAAQTKIDAGYVSRVLSLLDTEALITRAGRGRIETIDWPALLRRWATDSPLETRGSTATYLEPRGLPALLARLAKSNETYAVTGSSAAAAFAPIAPARLATIWLRDAKLAAERLGLRPAESGANVLLVEPADDNVFEGMTERDGVNYAAPSQTAADLLTSPGRGPAEAEELINWMRANEGAWRR